MENLKKSCPLPYASDKQRRYMNWAASKGKIKKSVVDEFNQVSKGLELPEKAPRFQKLKEKLGKK